MIFKDRQLQNRFLDSTHFIEVIYALKKFFDVQDCNYS